MLRCRKSPEGREFNARLRHPATGKLFCQPSSEWVPYFESGKNKAAKGEGWAPLSFAVPKIQWDFNSYCPYGKKAMGKLFCQPSSEWVPYFESGKDKAAKGEGWAPLSFAVPKIQWDSNSYCPYGKKAMGKLFEMNSHSYTCCMTCVVQHVLCCVNILGNMLKDTNTVELQWLEH